MPHILRQSFVVRLPDQSAKDAPTNAAPEQSPCTAKADAQARPVYQRQFRKAGHVPGLRRVIGLSHPATRVVSETMALA
ncbi:MAG TPA: hypothetical protein VEC35_13230 [Noviherbaspirillum sp.]|nr:hypothetical protein [Noviherbaspirillum sp.]